MKKRLINSFVKNIISSKGYSNLKIECDNHFALSDDCKKVYNGNRNQFYFDVANEINNRAKAAKNIFNFIIGEKETLSKKDIKKICKL